MYFHDQHDRSHMTKQEKVWHAKWKFSIFWRFWYPSNVFSRLNALTKPQSLSFRCFFFVRIPFFVPLYFSLFFLFLYSTVDYKTEGIRYYKNSDIKKKITSFIGNLSISLSACYFCVGFFFYLKSFCFSFCFYICSLLWRESIKKKYVKDIPHLSVLRYHCKK